MDAVGRWGCKPQLCLPGHSPCDQLCIPCEELSLLPVLSSSALLAQAGAGSSGCRGAWGAVAALLLQAELLECSGLRQWLPFSLLSLRALYFLAPRIHDILICKQSNKIEK